MKSLIEFLTENMNKKCPNCHKEKCICKSEEEECEKCEGEDCKDKKCKEEEEEESEKIKNDSEESIKDEKTFREYAENKFKTVFGDKLDNDKMNSVIDGILKDHNKDVEEGDWGTLVGILNKSFAN